MIPPRISPQNFIFISLQDNPRLENHTSRHRQSLTCATGTILHELECHCPFTYERNIAWHKPWFVSIGSLSQLTNVSSANAPPRFDSDSLLQSDALVGDDNDNLDEHKRRRFPERAGTEQRKTTATQSTNELTDFFLRTPPQIYLSASGEPTSQLLNDPTGLEPFEQPPSDAIEAIPDGGYGWTVVAA